MGQMDGKVAIVTGSGRGIGKEIALRLVRDGAKVVINDIDDAPAKETVAEIEKMGGKAVMCTGDVAKPDFGDRIVKTAVDAFGGCHVVVNNAGYTWDSVIQKMSDEQWYAILDVHLTAPFRILRAFQQHFRQAVEKERSAGKRIVRKVVNISSTSGVNGNAGQSNYSAGKAGIVGLTKTLAKEFGRYDVTVNAVAFGYIQTRLTKPLAQGEAGEIEVQGRKVKIGVQGGRIAAMNQMIPLGRGGLPDRGGGLGLPLLQPRQRLCQRPVPGGERRALIVLDAMRSASSAAASPARRRRPSWPMPATASPSSNASQSPARSVRGFCFSRPGLRCCAALGLAERGDGARRQGRRARGEDRAAAAPCSISPMPTCIPRRTGSASAAACCSTCCMAG